ncbi:MAG: ferredoxin--NADP reductase [Acidimicrobiales bacterium]|jgi:ferredoxin-NADP reductase
MALSGSATDASGDTSGAATDHSFHPLRVGRVRRETAEASSFVLDVPTELRQAFAYQAGQFCTFRVWVDGQPLVRCYSMCSSPVVDTELAVTVKRVPGGVVSNWMNDHLAPGDTLEVARPTGFFRLGRGPGDLVAFSAGSGITPVISLLKTALATTSRRVHLVYANRDRDSIIFRSEIDALRTRYGDRFTLSHHLDVEDGFIGPDAVRQGRQGRQGDDGAQGGRGGRDADGEGETEFYVCGPGPFMDIVEHTLLADGVDAARIHIERFTPAAWPPEAEVPADSSVAAQVRIELDGRAETTAYRSGTTILQTARQMGMSPPFSCEAGSCATCMARLVEGTASMHVNNALTDDEVADGWVLTCQALPTSPLVHVAYGYGEA